MEETEVRLRVIEALVKSPAMIGAPQPEVFNETFCNIVNGLTRLAMTGSPARPESEASEAA